MPNRTHNPTAPAHRPRRRRAGEAQQTGAPASAQDVELLRDRGADMASREGAAMRLQGALGNGAVARAIAGAPAVQRKGAGKKKPARAPATTTIRAPTRVTYPLEARTLREAAEAIVARGEAGETTWQPRWSGAVDENGVITSATVTVDVTITMPVWRGARRLRPRARAEWERAYAALEEHEQGHVGLVREHLGDLAQRMIGKTQAEAQELFDAAQQALQEASEAYDQRTDHGRNAGTEIDLSVEGDE